MSGKNVGYVRVSMVEAHTGSRTAQLEGVILDKVFEDMGSGKNMKRPALDRCLKFLQSGDTLHVHSFERLAGNLQDLEFLLSTLTRRSILVLFHKEGLSFSGDAEDHFQTLQFKIIGNMAEFERSIQHEYQYEAKVDAITALARVWP